MLEGKNIMFLVDRYNPYPSANGICCENIIEAFLENHCNVWIGSYKLPNDKLNKHNNCNLFSIGNITEIDNKTSFFVKLFHYCRWIFPFRKYPATLNYKKANAIIKKCRKIIAEESINYVICFHFPVEVLYAGYKLKSFFPKLIFISYIIDPIYGGFVPNHLSVDYCNKKNIRWENLFFERYDLNILMKSNFRLHDSTIINDRILKKTIALDVPYLKNNNKILQNKRENHTPVVFFCGLLEYPRRNVKFILDLAKKMINVKFVFAGRTNYKELMNSKPYDNIEYLGEISHTQVLKHLDESDFFLNLGVKSKSAVSGKIFEYMSYGKPIISTYSFDEEPCINYLKQYPLSYLIDENDTNLDRQVKDLSSFINNKKNCLVNFDSVKKQFIENLPESFYYFVDNFFEGGKK